MSLLPPSPPGEDPSDELRRLGERLGERVDEVLELTALRTNVAGHEIDATVQQSFERVSRTATGAVARWIGGSSIGAAIQAGRETWEIFSELAVHRAALLNEVVWRCFWWRNVMAEVIEESATELGIAPAVALQAKNLLQLSVEFNLLRMCECFEIERQRTDEELSRREQELSFLATHDALTGLPNRTLILDRAKQMLARSRRNQTPAAALFVDLDNFKDINDTLGHGAGDELLRGVAARLDGVIRETDALGRLGGDEFVVITEALALDAGPELVAERLLDALQHPFQLETAKTPVVVSASVGVAVADAGNAEDLLRNADIAMYRAKWEGRNRFAVFESGMGERVRNRVELEMDLRGALEQGQYRLAYQPTLDLGDLRPTGVEALLRWQHPARGTLEPESFIPLLEETGLITEVGAWVLEEACRQAAAWHASGFPLAVAVNVSGRQLDDDRIATDVEAALEHSGLDPAMLTVEVTETSLMRNVEETARRLTTIKQLGVRIAIDDFGTGYSSLAHLQRFPVDALKIDRSFITGLRDNREGGTLIHSLVQLGKALSIETFAEGIEGHEELSLLRAEECDSGQGFLFARPLDAAETEIFLRSWAADKALPR